MSTPTEVRHISTAMPIEHIALDKLLPDPTNPKERSVGDPELARTIAHEGLLQPLLVRPEPSRKGPTGRFIIIAGHRRRGSIALLPEVAPDSEVTKQLMAEGIPCVIYAIDAADALVLRAVENLQRKDLELLEEAAEMKRLVDAGKIDVPGIATQIGKSETYVRQRLELAEPSKVLREAIEKKGLPARHALLIGRFDETTQKELLERAIQTFYDGPRVINYGQLEKLVDEQVLGELKRVPWALDDAELVPKAGPCTTCPKNTANVGALFADIKGADGGRCTDRGCYAAKAKAFAAAEVDRLREKHGKAGVIAVSDDYSTSYGKDKAAKKLPTPGNYIEIGKHGAKTCDSAIRAVVAGGHEIGKTMKVCVDKGCKVHRSTHTSTTETPQARGKRLAESRKNRRDLEAREAAFVSLREIASPFEGPERNRLDLELVLQAVWHRLWSDAQKVWAKRHGILDDYKKAQHRRDFFRAWLDKVPKDSDGDDALRVTLLEFAVVTESMSRPYSAIANGKKGTEAPGLTELCERYKLLTPAERLKTLLEADAAKDKAKKPAKGKKRAGKKATKVKGPTPDAVIEDELEDQELDDGPACESCGCTENNACQPAGCAWSEEFADLGRHVCATPSCIKKARRRKAAPEASA